MLRDERLKTHGWCGRHMPSRVPSDSSTDETRARQSLKRIAQVIAARSFQRDRRGHEVLQRRARGPGRSVRGTHPRAEPHRRLHPRLLDGRATDEIGVPRAVKSGAFDRQRELIGRCRGLPPSSRAKAQGADAWHALDHSCHPTTAEPDATLFCCPQRFEQRRSRSCGDTVGAGTESNGCAARHPHGGGVNGNRRPQITVTLSRPDAVCQQ